MKLKLLVLLFPLVLTGCVVRQDDNEAAIETAASFEKPESVGILPDGREVFRVVKVNSRMHDHYIYFVGANGGVTVNHSVSQGKTTANSAVALIPEPQVENMVSPEDRARAEALVAEAARNIEEAKDILNY